MDLCITFFFFMGGAIDFSDIKESCMVFWEAILIKLNLFGNRKSCIMYYTYSFDESQKSIFKFKIGQHVDVSALYILNTFELSFFHMFWLCMVGPDIQDASKRLITFTLYTCSI